MYVGVTLSFSFLQVDVEGEKKKRGDEEEIIGTEEMVKLKGQVFFFLSQSVCD